MTRPYCWVSGGTVYYKESDIPRGKTIVTCYTAPINREWVGLTSEELASIIVEYAGFPTKQLKAIEVKLKGKNSV